jgi:hypothetical protein
MIFLLIFIREKKNAKIQIEISCSDLKYLLTAMLNNINGNECCLYYINNL